MANTDGETKNWWSTLPGILTGTAALITAIGGFLVILSSNGFFKRNAHQDVLDPNNSSATKSFVEDFTNNTNEWYLDTTDDHEIGILNGELYVFCKGNLTNAGRTSTFSKIRLGKYFPKYKIDLLCDFIAGDTSTHSPFGFILSTEGYDEYYQFNYFRNGLGNTYYVKNDSFVTTSKINGAQTQKRHAKLTVDISGDEYKYYVNNILIEHGKLQLLKFFTIRLFASRTQVIGFEKLEITPL